MGAYSDDGTLGFQELNGGHGGSDTGVIGDLLSVKWNVNIAADENLLSLQLIISEIFDGLLDLKLEIERRWGEAGNAESTCRNAKYI